MGFNSVFKGLKTVF